MITATPGRLNVLDGNIRLIDRTSRGVSLQVARGVDRQEMLNDWFGRYVARPPWADPTEEEREALFAPRTRVSPSDLIAIDVPAAIVDAFWGRFVSRVVATSSDEVRRAVLGEFQGFILGTLADDTPVRASATRTFDLVFSPPDASSTAFDPKSGKFVGMHLDDHENLPFDRRSAGFQLMGMNLGQAERYFQFINHDAASLIRLVEESSNWSGGMRTAASLIQAVFGAFPDCPVLRIALRPGQAYIAVTQDLIHDGATNTVGRPDVNVLIGGRFSLAGGE